LGRCRADQTEPGRRKREDGGAKEAPAMLIDVVGGCFHDWVSIFQ
jgi:hypothetical protein